MTNSEIERVLLYQQLKAIREMVILAAKFPESVVYSSAIDCMLDMADIIMRDVENRQPLKALRAGYGPSLTVPQSGVLSTPIVPPGPGPSPNMANVPVNFSQDIAKALGIPSGIVAGEGSPDSEQEADSPADKPDRKQQEMDFFFGKPGKR